MPGRHITDRQRRLFHDPEEDPHNRRRGREGGLQPRHGISARRDPSLPFGKAAPRGRRRPDPLVDIFETEVVPILEKQSGHPPGRRVSRR